MADPLKKNHHFVPQFWLRKFADNGGHIYRWDGKRTKQTGSDSVMSSDWLYTVYKPGWIASNELEDHLSKLESPAGITFNEIIKAQQLSTSTAESLVDFLALQACRHPDILSRNLRRVKELAGLFALAHDMNEAEFKGRAKDFGLFDTDASNTYRTLIAEDQKSLIKEHDRLQAFNLESQELPLSDFLHAVTPVANAMSHLDIGLLEAPAGEYFVIGDTPVPQNGAFSGFIAPLSKSLAVEFRNASMSPQIMATRTLSLDEIQKVNREQWENAKEVVIGPDPATLRLLI